MTVRILHEDRDVIVCIKPVGVSSQEGMIELLREAGASQALCVHRLDTAVGGVMVYAKSRRAAAALSQEIAARRMEKEYLAVCAGCPEPGEGVMRDLLFKDARANKTYVVNRMRRGVREAELKYSVLDTCSVEAEKGSLVSVRLKTGRSHQIRVQFASRRMPLLGDVKYGSQCRDCGIALWSRALAFEHPSGGHVEFSCPPADEYPWTLFDF